MTPFVRSPRTLLSALLITAFGLAAGASSLAAAPALPDANPIPDADSILAQLPEGSMVMDEAVMEEVSDLNLRIEPHLVIDADGLVSLPEDLTAAQLGVPADFLDNYRQALTFSNPLIASGEIRVNPDMSVDLAPSYAAKRIAPEPGMPGAQIDAGGGSEDQIQWHMYRYGHGLMFYTSYNTWYRYRYNYYSWCNSLAAYSGYPWMSRSFTYFYGYNRSYMNRYIYNTGGYYFLPYYNRCSGYSPCYGRLGYKPAYFYGRTYNSYTRGYSWGWRGYWCRY